MLGAALILCAALMGAAPFAFTDTVNGAIVAGIFSVVNTGLSLYLVRVTQQGRSGIQATAETLDVLRGTAQEAKDELHEHLTNGITTHPTDTTGKESQ